MGTYRQMRRKQEREDAKLAKQMGQAPAAVQRGALFRNGITTQDLDKEFKRGWDAAKKEIEEFCFHTIYAATLITLIDKNGMEQDKAIETLRDIDRQVLVCIEDEDIMKECYERTGVEFNWNDPVERIN